jgi:alkanesulfonate monooxygenase SsuD/methylene tetrahydromethanopterin reductase-like flavin-dependent oxidoreductase (luciferase family)
MMGVHVANNTTRIRIGMGVSLASFYHPLRLAEEIAFLDVLSGGRVNWGAGRGFDPDEFKVFGVPLEESGSRFHEAVEIVLEAWTKERINWSGEYWNFENVEVLPKPIQKPYPPTWLAAGSPGATRWAGKRGYSIMLGPHSTFAENAEHYAIYCDEMEKHGYSVTGREIPMTRFIAIGDSDTEAELIARNGVGWLAQSYMNSTKATKPESEDQFILTIDASAQVHRYLNSVVIHGCPGRVIDHIERLREDMNLQYLMAAPLSQSSFLMLTEKVLPHFM